MGDLASMPTRELIEKYNSLYYKSERRDEWREIAKILEGRAAWDKYDAPEGSGSAFKSISEETGIQAAPKNPDRERTWREAFSEAPGNLKKSGTEFAENLYQAVRHPIQTGGAMVDLAQGIYENVREGDQGFQEEGEMASEVGQFYKDRYGSAKGIKDTIAEDPVGFLADASAVFAPPAALAGKLPGVAGAAGRVAGKAAKYADPVAGSTKVAKKGIDVVTGGRGIRGKITDKIGTRTGAGALALEEAGRVGYEAGRGGRSEARVQQAAETFRKHLEGQGSQKDILLIAKGGVSALRDARQKAYKTQLAELQQASEIVDYGAVQQAVNSAAERFKFHGVFDSDSTEAALQAINKEIETWVARESVNPAFGTPEGADRLRRRLYGQVQSKLDPGTPEYQIVSEARKAIQAEIEAQAPIYSQMMTDYHEASKILEELERTLSLNPQAMPDTTLRKLHSVLRDNANTNYGQRVDLARQLDDAAGGQLFPALAGETLNATEARGLAKYTDWANPMLAGAGAAVGDEAGMLAGYGLGLMTQNPKAMGRAYYSVGHAAGKAEPLTKYLQKMPKQPLSVAGHQSGRIANLQDYLTQQEQ